MTATAVVQPAPRPFKLGMRALASAVTVVAVQGHDGTVAGLTATAVCSLSADPPSLLVCVNRNADDRAGAAARTPSSASTCWREDQVDVAQAFGGQKAVRGTGRFVYGQWSRSEHDVPLLAGRPRQLRVRRGAGDGLRLAPHRHRPRHRRASRPPGRRSRSLYGDGRYMSVGLRRQHMFDPRRPTLRYRLDKGDTLGVIWLSLGSVALVRNRGAVAARRRRARRCSTGCGSAQSMEQAIGVVPSDIPVLVRVAENTPMAIGQALDAGAEGVIVPLVETAKQARRAVEAARYPPHGARSGGGIRPLADFVDYVDAGRARHRRPSS